MIKVSQKVQDALNALVQNDKWDEIEDELYDSVVDGTCTSGYDNDGSTGGEIFENGFRLGVAAAAKIGPDIRVWSADHPNALVRFFFIGTEEDVVAKLNGLLA